MLITDVEIREFYYPLADVGTRNGHQVYEPGSTLKQPGFVLTIRTADGLEGQYRGFMFTMPMVTQVKMATGEFLLGRAPLEREGIWQDLWLAFLHTDRIGVGPIDNALRDLAGKHYGASVAELLGGYRTEIPAYASTFMGDEAGDGLSFPASYADFARDCHDSGYPVFKINPIGDPMVDVEICRGVAEAVGDEMDLMLDPERAYRTFAETLRVGRVLDELDFFWYEDPMADCGESMQWSRKLVDELDTTILGAERVRSGPYGWTNHLVAEALDLVRVYAHLDGGITGVMKFATVAESFGTDVERHVGGPEHLHCLSAIRNTNYFERGLLHLRGQMGHFTGVRGGPRNRRGRAGVGPGGAWTRRYNRLGLRRRPRD